MYWETVSDKLKSSLYMLMQAELFNDFRLVGGTALSLHLGHRISVDIDLFTDKPYGSINFEKIDEFLKKNYAYVDANFDLIPGMGRSYFLGDSPNNTIKLDVYYTNDPFMHPFVEIDGIRMATLEEIVSMKIDVVQRGGRKKDFWDLHEVIPKFSLEQMLKLHSQRHKWTHDEKLILANFTDFKHADSDFEPICLRQKNWEFIKDDLIEFVNRKRN